MDNKQAVLVEMLAKGVQDKQASEFARLAEEMAKLTVTCNTILARVEMLDAAAPAGAAPKRAIRTGGAKKDAAAKPGGAKKPAGSDTSRVTNALLYFRYALGNNLEETRETFCSAESLAEAEADPTVAKKDQTKDESGYYSAVGAFLWKKVLTDDQKEEVRSQFLAWKEQITREGAEPQLEEEADE